MSQALSITVQDQTASDALSVAVQDLSTEEELSVACADLCECAAVTVAVEDNVSVPDAAALAAFFATLANDAPDPHVLGQPFLNGGVLMISQG